MAAAQTNANEQILRERAYLIWEQSGRPFGQADLHWQMAKELTEKIEDPKPRTASSKSRPKKKIAGAPAPSAEIGRPRKEATALYQ
jgi:hypothetical protein